ncbi:MAG: apolipoprotein N-acyltransferase [Bacteroidetes bacterium]|nr:MAG: apolipoprotein N-acyltransferase [Bacteroidota bacterium]
MIQNRKLKLAVLTLLPGILFWLAWPPRDLFFLSFIAFVPLLLLEKETNGKKGGGWLMYASLAFWNLILSWWVFFAEYDEQGLLPALLVTGFMMLANAWLMYLPWWGYRKARKFFGDKKALLVLVTLWLSYEYLHLNWQFTWPWFTLGNIFAKHNYIIQWYEITGAMGGSLWVLFVNVLFYKCLQMDKWTKWIKPALAVIIPMLISIPFLIKSQLDYQLDVNKALNGYEALLVQPNINPHDKFNKGEEVSNLKKMLTMVDSAVTDKTRYVIMPETAIVEYVDEDQPNRFESIQLLQEFTKKHPNTYIITGASTYNWYDQGEERQATARETENGQYYESYNTALEINPEGELDIYHKSKLVPGAEKMPYPEVLNFLDFLALDLGGISGSLGRDKEPKNFDAGENPDVAPLICYESVFPGYVSQFTRKGAEILLVITNDGWWRDTDGYKQHMYYACLRAIENRREVLRSANTGITCRIDKLGTIQEHTKWWEPTVLKVDVNSFTNITFYVAYGDYIGRFASFIGIFFLLGMFVKSKSKLGKG